MAVSPKKGDVIAVRFYASMTDTKMKTTRYSCWKLARVIKADRKGRVIKFRVVADPTHIVSDVDAIPVQVYTINGEAQNKARDLADAIGKDHEKNHFAADEELKKAIINGL
jgi:hypothetical protein